MLIYIYSLEGCPFSKKAEILSKKLKSSKICNLNEKIQTTIFKIKQYEKNIYKKKNNYQTFPQIFIDGELIGGLDNFEKYIKNNKLITFKN